jgi:hypothetical protein
MFEFYQAQKLADTWVEIYFGKNWALKSVVTLPYGWLLYYDTREFVVTKNIETSMNAIPAILVNRITLELLIPERNVPINEWLANYEAGLPRFFLEEALPQDPR